MTSTPSIDFAARLVNTDKQPPTVTMHRHETFEEFSLISDPPSLHAMHGYSRSTTTMITVNRKLRVRPDSLRNRYMSSTDGTDLGDITLYTNISTNRQLTRVSFLKNLKYLADRMILHTSNRWQMIR